MSVYYETADIHSASDEYANRFAGEVGEYFLETQRDALFSLLSQGTARSVLDVGGGHGQVAAPLAKAGYSVTVLASGEEGTRQIERQPHLGIETRIGQLLSIPCEAKTFDLVTCFRIVPHCEKWPQLIAELCRVSKRSVVVDFPVRASVNALTPLLFGVKKQIETNTRPYLLFSEREIIDEFARHGFQICGARKQFFWPMALHRAVKSAWLSRILESAARVVGLQQLFGSPVIARFDSLS